MKVKELIEKLQRKNQDSEVALYIDYTPEGRWWMEEAESNDINCIEEKDGYCYIKHEYIHAPIHNSAPDMKCVVNWITPERKKWAVGIVEECFENLDGDMKQATAELLVEGRLKVDPCPKCGSKIVYKPEIGMKQCGNCKWRKVR